MFNNPDIETLQKRICELEAQLEETFLKNHKNLENMVEERTSTLKQINNELQKEIEEKKRMEVELRESETQHRLLADNVSDVIWTMDMKERFTYVSPSIQKLLGYTQEEALLISLKNTLTPESYKNAIQVITKAVSRDGEPGVSPNVTLSLVLDHIQKNGVVVCVEITTSFIRDEDGLPSGFIGISRDITERKRAEEQRDKLIIDLQKALGDVKTLSGLLPICSHCKNIRDDKGYWDKIESYIHKHSDTQFSHGICPECAKKYYPDMDLYEEAK